MKKKEDLDVWLMNLDQDQLVRVFKASQAELAHRKYKAEETALKVGTKWYDNKATLKEIAPRAPDWAWMDDHNNGFIRYTVVPFTQSMGYKAPNKSKKRIMNLKVGQVRQILGDARSREFIRALVRLSGRRTFQ